MTTGHQVEVVAAGKSWAASPHLYAYQPAHFHFQEEQFDLGVSVLLNGWVWDCRGKHVFKVWGETNAANDCVMMYRYWSNLKLGRNVVPKWGPSWCPRIPKLIGSIVNDQSIQGNPGCTEDAHIWSTFASHTVVVLIAFRCIHVPDSPQDIPGRWSTSYISTLRSWPIDPV